MKRFCVVDLIHQAREAVSAAAALLREQVRVGRAGCAGSGGGCSYSYSSYGSCAAAACLRHWCCCRSYRCSSCFHAVAPRPAFQLSMKPWFFSTSVGVSKCLERCSVQARLVLSFCLFIRLPVCPSVLISCRCVLSLSPSSVCLSHVLSLPLSCPCILSLWFLSPLWPLPLSDSASMPLPHTLLRI